MKKLYTVRFFVEAQNPAEAMRIVNKRRYPDDVYVSDEWMNRVGYIAEQDEPIKGFRK